MKKRKFLLIKTIIIAALLLVVCGGLFSASAEKCPFEAFSEVAAGVKEPVLSGGIEKIARVPDPGKVFSASRKG